MVTPAIFLHSEGLFLWEPVFSKIGSQFLKTGPLLFRKSASFKKLGASFEKMTFSKNRNSWQVYFLSCNIFCHAEIEIEKVTSGIQKFEIEEVTSGIRNFSPSIFSLESY